MKNWPTNISLVKVCVFVLLLLALGSTSAVAQTIKVYYIGPTNTMIAVFGAQNIKGGYAHGLRGVEITPANENKFKKFGSPNMVMTYENLQPGKDLRKHVDKVLKISGGKVDVNYLLVDDRAGLNAAKAGIFRTQTYTAGATTQTTVWPAASVKPAKGGRYEGWVLLGEESATSFSYSSKGQQLHWEGVVVHETAYTQFVGKTTTWSIPRYSYSAGSRIWMDEIMLFQAYAFVEGITMFFCNARNDPNGITSLNMFFNRSDYRYRTDNWSVHTRGMMSIHHKTVKKTPPVTPSPGVSATPYTELQFKWRDLPAYRLELSETTSQAFHTYFWQYVNNNKTQAYDMIVKSAGAMWTAQFAGSYKRNLFYAVNQLALQLENYAKTTQGKAAKSAGTLTSSMFPFALLDAITHFGMSEKEYKRLYEANYRTKNPKAYTVYWKHRNTVENLIKTELTASPIQFDTAVQKLHKYFQGAATIL